MAVNFLHPGFARRHARTAANVIDWDAARRADRSCCCPAKPVVMVIMPAVPGRPHQTELLLCGHHYRVSQRALEAAGATVVEIGADQLADASWPLGRVGV